MHPLTSTHATFTDVEHTEGRTTTEGDPPIHARAVLPGESAHVHLVKQRRRRLLGEALHIRQQSMSRRPARESHYLSCSPWQIMTYEAQRNVKYSWITQALREPDSFYAAPQEFGYRTNIQYGFAGKGNTLQFRLRGHNSHLVAANGCILASDTMNAAAQEVRSALADMNIDSRNIKSLMIRESKSTNTRLAILYVFPETFPEIPPHTFNHTDGVIIAQVDPTYRMPITRKIISVTGQDFLEEKINDITVRYNYADFWQNNMPLFTQALTDIQTHIIPNSSVVELYAGTGVIGLSLHTKAKDVHMYEMSESMVTTAQENIARNNITNATVESLKAESVLPRHLEGVDCVIVDPTRRGLAQETVDAIKTTLPQQVVYLSCNITTLTRDIGILKENYTPQYIAGYDFYPNTPHLETLVVLTKKT